MSDRDLPGWPLVLAIMLSMVVLVGAVVAPLLYIVTTRLPR